MNIIILNIFNNPINVGFQSFLKKFIFILESTEERKKEMEWNTHWMPSASAWSTEPASQAHALTRTFGWPFSLLEDTQPTEPPGQGGSL